MALLVFSVILSDPTYSRITPFSIFCIALSIFVVCGVRDFKVRR